MEQIAAIDQSFTSGQSRMEDTEFRTLAKKVRHLFVFFSAGVVSSRHLFHVRQGILVDFSFASFANSSSRLQPNLDAPVLLSAFF